MTAKIEAGKGWVADQQIVGEYGKIGIRYSGPLYAPIHLGEEHSLKLFTSTKGEVQVGEVQVWSSSTHSVIKGHLPDEATIKGQVLYHSLFGTSTFVLIGLGAAIRWGEIGSEYYLKVENEIDLPGEVISK